MERLNFIARLVVDVVGVIAILLLSALAVCVLWSELFSKPKAPDVSDEKKSERDPIHTRSPVVLALLELDGLSGPPDAEREDAIFLLAQSLRKENDFLRDQLRAARQPFETITPNKSESEMS